MDASLANEYGHCVEQIKLLKVLNKNSVQIGAHLRRMKELDRNDTLFYQNCLQILGYKKEHVNKMIKCERLERILRENFGNRGCDKLSVLHLIPKEYDDEMVIRFWNHVLQRRGSTNTPLDGLVISCKQSFVAELTGLLRETTPNLELEEESVSIKREDTNDTSLRNLRQKRRLEDVIEEREVKREKSPSISSRESTILESQPSELLLALENVNTLLANAPMNQETKNLMASWWRDTSTQFGIAPTL